MLYLRFYISLLCTIFMGSCATILNSSTAPVHISVSEPSTVLIDSDTIAKMQSAVMYRVPRKKPNIWVHASNGEDKTKEFLLTHKLSILGLSNIIGPFSWLGLAVDGITGRGMTYPHTVYIDFDDSENMYLQYTPQNDAKKNFIKFAPFKIAGMINLNPAVELAYERVLTRQISAQVRMGYLLPRAILEIEKRFPTGRKGYLLSAEPRIYLKNKAPYGLYLGLEGSYLKSDYSSILLFELPDSDGQYNDDQYGYEYRETYQDSVVVHKRNSAINIKIGYQHVYKRWSIDFYAGLGALYKNVWHTNRLYPEHDMVHPRHPNVWYYAEKEQQGWTVGVPLNIAVAYRF
ncbi:MAG TPA: hypothetical protein PKA53_08245 [Sphingobacterium sp.]|nr:hypothetical protein [Sphingobacterium sp.]